MADKRPVARSGNNEERADYSTGQPPQLGQGMAPPAPTRKCKYLDRIAALSKVFTPEECKRIISTGINDWQEQDALIQRDEGKEIKQNFVDDYDYRNTTLFIPPEPDEWLFSKVLGAIMEFNYHATGYQFHVSGLAEPPNLMRYQAADIDKHGKPGKYDWHIDVGPGEVPSMRKISYTLILNPNEYEGGELCFHVGRTMDPFPGQDEAGTMILFPSYLVHKVNPITSGTRYALVGWAHGNSFV